MKKTLGFFSLIYFFIPLALLEGAFSPKEAIATVQTAEAIESKWSKLNANNDHGFWFDNNFEKHLPLNFFMRFHTEHRWGNDYRKLWYQEYTLTLQYDMTRFLKKYADKIVSSFLIGPAYNAVYQFQKNTEGHYQWVYISECMLQADLVLSKWGWRIQQRLRGELHHYCKNHYKDYALYRHRLTIFTPWKITRWNINPFIANEWFFRKNTYHQSHPTGLVGGWYQNRFRIGIMLDLSPDAASAALYWQWRTDKTLPDIHPRWINLYTWGLSTVFPF
ncbi:DUF2490 domain-containing protein [Candidatus Protochlamydia phocaeensis]|uniref:DUF2490 domain-containing protein n=1 Tax=Candidatus Protochlamydia phocaeensis TaxID=1414722 RepID=UPI0008381BB5|nr:DUF2490 domain-containing protein [Candidatus Protochlamydia phocaeensis]